CPAGISPVFIWSRSWVPPWRSRPRWVLISWFTWIGPRFKQTPGQLSGKGNEMRCFGMSIKTDSTKTANTSHGNSRFTTESLKVHHASRCALSRSRASRISRSNSVSPSIGGVLPFVCSVAGIDGTVGGGPAASAALSSSLSALRKSSRSWSDVRRRSPTTRLRSRATLRAEPGHEEQAVGCERAEAPRLVGVRRADHESAAVRRKALDTALDHALVEGTTCDFEVLEVARAGIARPREDKRKARAGRERLDRVEPDVRRDGRRVGVERIEEGIRIRSRSVRYVPTLGIEDHRNVRGNRLQGQREHVHRRAAVALVEGEIGLVRTHVRSGRADDAAQKPNGGLRSTTERFGDRGGFGIETDTEDAVVRALRRAELCEEGQLSRI